MKIEGTTLPSIIDSLRETKHDHRLMYVCIGCGGRVWKDGNGFIHVEMHCEKDDVCTPYLLLNRIPGWKGRIRRLLNAW